MSKTSAKLQVTVARRFPFILRCACCALTKVHSSPTKSFQSVIVRGRGAEPMQTSLETPKRANTGVRVPEVANSLAYTRISLSDSLLLLFLPSASPLRGEEGRRPARGFHPRRFARLCLTAEAIQGRCRADWPRKRRKAIPVMIRKIAETFFWPGSLGVSFRAAEDLDGERRGTLERPR